ncbi:MAG: L-2-hydroxyglutarate oxidase [Xanthobacteraceae bacterium]
MIHDFCVIGGGIVGLATALELIRRRPGATIVVIEKERTLAKHQTGHNSGVIHAGIYYKPGSLKADLCRRGAKATKDFCRDHGIPFETRGKLVVAATTQEMARMGRLQDNARENGIAVEAIDKAELSRREPNVSGAGALFVPETGIVNYRQICDAMGRLLLEGGGSIEFGAEIDAIQEGSDAVTVSAGERHWSARRLVACGGLQSDRLARLAGLKVDYQIVPFRGEYYDIVAAKRDLVRHLIYPVPDPDLPFLGIHLTPMIDGALTVGPNAVLGFAREGYRRFSFDLKDVLTYARFPGFWRVIAGNFRSGLSEAGNSLFKARYLSECRKYCPSLELGDLVVREAGIRAQAVMHDGTLVHDFMFLRSPRMLHVCNAPSPAATSAIPIAEMIAREVIESNSAR